ncbi:MAG: hydroxymethylpyrimidine/phosphomethylpyrimidine kinase [Ferruginibacter sp.]
MHYNRPIVLSIAGMDPSAGAGLLADIKTFEQHKVYGLGISTAQTLQTERAFFSVKWEETDAIAEAIKKMLAHYDVSAVKIGIVENISTLNEIVSLISLTNNKIKIVLDPVIKSSTGFSFWNEISQDILLEMLTKIFLITPNYHEVLQLFPSTDAKKSAQELSRYCNVLLKGGHNKEETGVDYLYTKNGVEKMTAQTENVFPKHGSGCVLSAAITANIALGDDLAVSCKKAKKYIEQFLTSNETLLGNHHV